MVVSFGDVMLIDFVAYGKSVQGGLRPGVIIQNDDGNNYSPTTLAIPLTRHLKKTNLPCHRILKKTRLNGLAEDSMMLGEQTRVIDKKAIKCKLGSLSEEECEMALAAYFANVPKMK